MLPRFSRVNRRFGLVRAVLLKVSWGTLDFGITIFRKPLVNNFDDALYPQQGIRNLVAIGFMLLLHIFVAYWLLHKDVDQIAPETEHRERIMYLDLSPDRQDQGKTTQPQQLAQAEPKSQLKSQPKSQPKSSPSPRRQSARRASPKSRSMTITPSRAIPPIPNNITDQIALARERRNTLEAEAERQNQEAKVANNANARSEDEQALARMKANIQSTQYKRKGVNGIFQVLDKGVRTGRFSFRGWTNNADRSTWQTFEVDAGLNGNVELALVRRMITLIRSHYSGDFNWESQRLGRVVVLSARPEDNAQLERFLMKEFFGG